MIKDTGDTGELFAAFDNAANEVVEIISAAGEKEINTIPFKDSWTAAQVSEHIRKAVESLTKALEKKAPATDRNPAERAGELRSVFLNYDTKFKSPEFILPGEGPFDQHRLVADLKQAFENIKAARANLGLSELINHPAFGEITKLELLHFVLYHTQRHLDQMKRVMAAVKEGVTQTS